MKLGRPTDARSATMNESGVESAGQEEPGATYG